MRAATLFLLAGVLAAETPKLAEPLQSIVELAHAAPPEFAADALLRVVESGKIKDRDARRDLVEQAFQLAASARFQLRMRALPGASTDTQAGSLGQAYDLKLDSLSLQSRAVRDMLAIDIPKARELFQTIPPPPLAPLTCNDALVYDVSDFYQTLSEIVSRAFLPAERKKEEHLNFLLTYVAQATSPLQLLPLERVIRNANVTPAQRDVLWTTFNGLVEGMRSDGRSFSASLTGLVSENAPEAQASIEKYRRQGVGCPEDGGSINPPTSASSAPRAATPSARPVAPPTPKVERYWQSGEAQRLLQGGLKLRATPTGGLLTDADRAAPEWQREVTDYLSDLAGWTSGSETSDAVFYHEKCTVYQALVELIPLGPLRDETLAAFVNFVSNSDLQQQSPVEWFVEPNSMLERVRRTHGEESRRVLDAYQRSGNPVLILHTALERALGAPSLTGITGQN